MTEIRYRLATANDAPGIFAVLEEVAAEIPVLLDLPERRSKVLGQIQACCASGETWVALDRGRTIVGFLLAEPDQLERFHQNNNALHLPYGGVRGSHRGRRIFPSLAEKIMEKGVPRTATVKRANKSDMLSRLLKLGFVSIASANDQDDLRWGS